MVDVQPSTPNRPTQAAGAQSILVADDEESMRHFVTRGLRRRGYQVEAVSDGEAAVARFGAQRWDAAVIDLRMPGLDGLGVLGRVRALDPAAVVLMMTAHGTVATAVEAMQLGAADFVQKPFEIEELALRIERAVAVRRAMQENTNLRRLLDRDPLPGLVGSSAALEALRTRIDLLHDSTATVLLTGESGTGKGVLARALHQRSDRRDEPFVVLHCAAVPDTLFESELFGYEAGAFTGAVQSKSGLVARAHRGTLFLDAIAEMSLPAQAKIERFLQDREFTPIGGTRPQRVDVRIVAATNRDLAECVQNGTFRAELFWRLEVVRLHMPPLRERREDIALLVVHRLQRLAEGGGRAPKTITAEALAALTAHEWPGNVRELENVCERMVVLAGDRPALGVDDLPEEFRAPSGSGATDFEAARARFERAYFTALLTRCGGSITEAARHAGISRGHLHRKLRELQFDASALRGLDLDRGEPDQDAAR